MPDTEKRSRLTHDFLGLAGRIERLIHTDPKVTTLPDPGKLKRWQALYADNAATVLNNRKVLLDSPARVSGEDLEQWVEDARKTLTQTPPDEPATW